MDGSIVVGIIEIKVHLLPDNTYQCRLVMSPEPVGRPDSTIVAKPSDNLNGALRNLLEIIDRFPLFAGKIT